MVGICGIGVHVPRLRLAAETIANEWGRSRARGSKAVANYDEDALTQGIQAVLNCVKAFPEARAAENLFFASTTSPFAEKQASSLVAKVARLPRHTFTLDIASSLRGATAALRVAADTLAAKPGQTALVVASDCRLAEPGSDLELSVGDGAGALLLGSEGCLLNIEAISSVSEEFLDVWRLSGDRYLKEGDTAFNRAMGGPKLVGEAATAALNASGVSKGEIGRVIMAFPDKAAAEAVRKVTGVATVELSPLLQQIGYAGSATPIMLLAEALETAVPGELLMLVGYGAGNADAIVLRATDLVTGQGAQSPMRLELAQTLKLARYREYLSMKNILPVEDLDPYASIAMGYGEASQNLQLMATQCKGCGEKVYPQRRICAKCGAKDHWDLVPLAMTGVVYTFAREHLYPVPRGTLVMAVADLEGGEKFYGMVTDCEAEAAAVGMEVELCFRKIHDGGGFPNYFWKLRPRAGQGV